MPRAHKKPQKQKKGTGGPAYGNPMAEQVGPDFFDAIAMRAALSHQDEPISETELAELLDQRAVLGLRTADEQWIFPTWQVHEGVVLPGLAQALAALSGQPQWSIGLWLTTPHAELADRTPVAALMAGDSERVGVLAAETAERWS